MGNKRDKRQARRRHHGAAQAQRRRDREQVVAQALESLGAALERLAEAASGDEVLPEAFAEMAVGLFAEDVTKLLMADADLASEHGEALGIDLPSERGRDLVGALELRLDEEPRLAWFLAGLAAGVGDLAAAERALELAYRKLEGGVADAAAHLGRLRFEDGRLGESIELAETACERFPEHDQLQALRARCMGLAAMLIALASGRADPTTRKVAEVIGVEPPSPAELETAVAAIARFEDRTRMYELRQALGEFVASDDRLARWQHDEIERFVKAVRTEADLGPLDELGDDGEWRISHIEGEPAHDAPGSGVNAAEEGLAALAGELSWVLAPEATDGDKTSDRDRRSDEGSLLELFAASPDARPDLAADAMTWLQHVQYGLWQADLPAPNESDLTSSGGHWVTDLITRRRLYVSIPPEQLDGLPRWSVLAGTMVPVGGVWRTGATVLVLEPSLADEVVEECLAVADAVVSELAREHGIKAPQPHRPRHGRARPHGVLVDLADEMEPAEAAITAKIVGASFASVVALVEIGRRRRPTLSNTDGDPLELITATFPAADPLLVRKRLLAEDDFEGDDGDAAAAADDPDAAATRTGGAPGGGDELEDGELATPLRWLGRVMTPTEAKSSFAQYQAEAKRQGFTLVEPHESERRWLRGSIHFHHGEIRAELNSRRRLELVTASLRRAGAGEPRVERLLDPNLDLPIPGGRLLGGRGNEPEVEAAWREAWLDERIPALDGATPRRAARDHRRRVLLESLLRRFEHDADVMAMRGERPLDVDALRRELEMRDGVLGDYDSD